MIVLVGVLVWALVRIKKQNDLIVAKVEKMKEEENDNMPKPVNDEIRDS